MLLTQALTRTLLAALTFVKLHILTIILAHEHVLTLTPVTAQP